PKAVSNSRAASVIVQLREQRAIYPICYRHSNNANPAKTTDALRQRRVETVEWQEWTQPACMVDRSNHDGTAECDENLPTRSTRGARPARRRSAHCRWRICFHHGAERLRQVHVDASAGLLGYTD